MDSYSNTIKHPVPCNVVSNSHYSGNIMQCLAQVQQFHLKSHKLHLSTANLLFEREGIEEGKLHISQNKNIFHRICTNIESVPNIHLCLEILSLLEIENKRMFIQSS